MALKLIIDTDPGIDDAMAILYAIAAPEIDLLGLTTVFGNVTTPKATRNALYLLEQAGIEIPVAEGLHRPRILPPFPPTSAVHGAEGELPTTTLSFGRISPSLLSFQTPTFSVLYLRNRTKRTLAKGSPSG